MRQKLTEIWTTDELLKLINEVNNKNPVTVVEYRQGWEDACAYLFNTIAGNKEKIKHISARRYC